MRKFETACITLAFVFMVAGCASQSNLSQNESVLEASSSISVEPVDESDEESGDASTESITLESADTDAVNADDSATEDNASDSSDITDEVALSAIKNYCYETIPGLQEIIDSGVEVYWEIESSSDEEVVVLFRSYTGAECRYHVDRASGDTYYTEFVPGITSQEMLSDEKINAKDYIVD